MMTAGTQMPIMSTMRSASDVLGTISPPLGSTGFLLSRILSLSACAIGWYATVNSLKELYNEFEQDIIVQEFISGYEVQVPIIIGEEPLALPPVAITMNNSADLAEKIITYELAFSEEYNFINFSSINNALSEKLMHESIKVAKCLGMENYGRVDFRIDYEGNYYITDISTHPYLINHSAFAFAFQEMGFNYKDIFACIIQSAYLKYS